MCRGPLSLCLVLFSSGWDVEVLGLRVSRFVVCGGFRAVLFRVRRCLCLVLSWVVGLGTILCLCVIAVLGGGRLRVWVGFVLPLGSRLLDFRFVGRVAAVLALGSLGGLYVVGVVFLVSTWSVS